MLQSQGIKKFKLRQFEAHLTVLFILFKKLDLPEGQSLRLHLPHIVH